MGCVLSALDTDTGYNTLASMVKTGARDMKRILLASAGVLAMVGLIGSAHAADLPRQQMPARAPVYAAPYYNWTGLYVGINGGGAFGLSRWDSTRSVATSGGVIGGA